MRKAEKPLQPQTRSDPRPLTLRIHFLGHLERVRVGQVHVGRRDGQDEAALPADKLQDHVPDLELDVLRLIPHRHLGDPREVDQCQVQHWGDTGGVSGGIRPLDPCPHPRSGARFPRDSLRDGPITPRAL